MPHRLSPLDVSFLYLETSTTPMHVGGVAILAPPEGGPLDHEALCRHVGERIAHVPRYRQKLRWVPGHLANPVWVDDPQFDVAFHVRRSALPRPGTRDQLRELVGRLMGRPLDRSRPLWEIYLVEGLEDGSTAVVTKTHHAMVDGISAVDIGTVILDPTPQPRTSPPDAWSPEPEPSSLELLTSALATYATRPATLIDTVRGGIADVRATAARLGATAGGVLSTVATAARPAPSSPLNQPIGEQRRFGMARTDLDDYKRVRKMHGGTVNDVVLATVSGALRSWLLSRGEAVRPSTTVRAMVPVSVRSEQQKGALGNRVSSYLVDLPVGESSPVVRLQRVSFAMKAHKESGAALGADTLVQMSGFTPPTLHALGARVAAGFTRRLFNLVVTNVPGPQLPLYAAGAEMLECYPVVPLARDQAVCVGLTSYNGGVYYGLNADRDALADVDTLAAAIEESLAELVGTVR